MCNCGKGECKCKHQPLTDEQIIDICRKHLDDNMDLPFHDGMRLVQIARRSLIETRQVQNELNTLKTTVYEIERKLGCIVVNGQGGLEINQTPNFKQPVVMN